MQIGVTLADGFIKDFPQKEATSTKRDKKLQARREKAINLLFAKAATAAKHKKFNMYQRAKLGQAFQGHLLDAGYDQEIVRDLTKDVLIRFA